MKLLSIAVAVLITFMAFIAGVYAYGMSHLREIKDNWVQYRCNPIYMPLAGAVGSDILTNFTNCSMQNVQSYAGFVLDPIFQNFAIFTDLFKNILESIQFIRKKMGGTVDAFMGIVSSMFGKIQNTMGSTLQLVGRIRTIMNRIISVFVVMLHIAKTGIASGESIDNGPIGQIARFLCFDPETMITMLDKSLKRAGDINVGNILQDGTRITSVMIFDGIETPMFYLGDIRVSGNHKVLYNNMWILCSDHPDAVPAESIPRIICFNTNTHLIPIGKYIFKDYEETDNVRGFYTDVADYYKSEVPPLRFLFRETGFDILNTRIRMEDGTVKHINDISIGDRVMKGGEVMGAILHELHDSLITLSEGVSVAPGTILLNDTITTAATERYASNETDPNFCANLLTENALVVLVDNDGNDWTILDDQEVPDPTVHTKRDNQVLKQ
jgi:hypothetical protein